MDAFFTDLLKLFTERHNDFKVALDGLPPEAANWQPGEGMNSLAVLAFHSAGAERFWVGDVAMREPLARDRPGEFAKKELTAEQALARLDWSFDYMRGAFERLTTADLVAPRIDPRDGAATTVGWAILHALEHTAMHAGHAQITRQLWNGR